MTIIESKGTKQRNSKQPICDETPLLLQRRDGDEQTNEFSCASFSGAVFNLSTTIIGAGIMALPATMKVLGLGLGIGMIVLVAVLTYGSLEMLLRYSRVGKVDSYGGVMEDAFGGFGRVLLQICILVNNVGTLVVYMIIIGDVLCGTSSSGVHHAGVLEGWFGEYWWSGRTFVLLVITLVIFSPLAGFKRIDSFRYTSALALALAVVFLVITAAITVIRLFSGSIEMPRLLPKVTDITSVWNLFTAIPVLVTAFICHFNVHTIDNELQDPSLIKSVIQASLTLCSCVYIMTSFFGFLLFGDSTLDDVLANFDTDLGVPYSYILNDIVRISYALHLMLVFPMLFHPLRLNFDGLIFPSASKHLTTDNRRFVLISIGLLLVVFLGANFVPSIWTVFQFTGATATVCLGFIFPAAIVLRDAHGVANNKEKILAVLMIGVAVFSNSVAVYSDATALFKKKVLPDKDL